MEFTIEEVAVSVEVEVYGANIFNIGLDEARGIVLDGIHAQKDYVELEAVFIDPELERHDPSLLGAD